MRALLPLVSIARKQLVSQKFSVLSDAHFMKYVQQRDTEAGLSQLDSTSSTLIAKWRSKNVEKLEKFRLLRECPELLVKAEHNEQGDCRAMVRASRASTMNYRWPCLIDAIKVVIRSQQGHTEVKVT